MNVCQARPLSMAPPPPPPPEGDCCSHMRQHQGRRRKKTCNRALVLRGALVSCFMACALLQVFRQPRRQSKQLYEAQQQVTGWTSSATGNGYKSAPPPPVLNPLALDLVDLYGGPPWSNTTTGGEARRVGARGCNPMSLSCACLEEWGSSDRESCSAAESLVRLGRLPVREGEREAGYDMADDFPPPPGKSTRTGPQAGPPQPRQSPTD